MRRDGRRSQRAGMRSSGSACTPGSRVAEELRHRRGEAEEATWRRGPDTVVDARRRAAVHTAAVAVVQIVMVAGLRRAQYVVRRSTPGAESADRQRTGPGSAAETPSRVAWLGDWAERRCLGPEHLDCSHDGHGFLIGRCSRTRHADRCVARHGHSGTFPCLRRGSSSRFVDSIRSPATSFRRVSAGSMTSSMYPRSAAAYGLAYFSV